MTEKIAVVFDFDDTLAPDTTTGFLEFMGHDSTKFWKEDVDPLVDDGWDPHTAYLYGLIKLSNSLPDDKKITKAKFEEWGRKVKHFPGVPELFGKIRNEVKSISDDLGKEIKAEFYVISAGIKEILDEVSVRNEFNMLWASRFEYDKATGEILFPKNLISFTDKTRYLFHISKGLTDEKYLKMPFEVNEKTQYEDFKIKFKKMIFIGDGLTDVPCFSLVRKYGGETILVYDRARRDKWEKAYKMLSDKRVSGFASTDYTEGSDLYVKIVGALRNICSGE